jgi:hypothetical protein
MEKKDEKPVWASQSGQAVVEYMLVLIVTIGICGGALWQFDDAFRAFASSYFGSYLACLLETGELPSMGASSTSSSSDGTCNDSFQAFNISNGRPLNGYSGINSGGANGAAAAGKNSGNSAARATTSNRGSGAGDPSFGRFDRGRPEVAVEKKSGAGAQDEKNQGDLGFMGGGSKRPALVSTSEKRTALDYSSLISSEEEKKEEGRVPTKVSSQKNDSLRAKKAIVQETRKPASKEDEDKEWTVGGFMRWIIIIAIIVALVVFIGGQALQISKGGEE